MGSLAAAGSADDQVDFMMRVIALTAVLGAAAAAAAAYLAVPITRQQIMATSQSATAAGDGWPICTTMGSLGGEADWAALDADFATGKRALADGKWRIAITAFELAALREPGNADIQNYIGYAYRRLHEPERALAHFERAIAINPRHRAAHQHLGEFHVAAGNLANAEEHLAALDRICLIPCAERADLHAAILQVTQTAGR